MVLKDAHTHCKEEQWQLVQSDQGYISSSSLQTPNKLTEMEEEEEQDPGQPALPLSPERERGEQAPPGPGGRPCAKVQSCLLPRLHR